MAFCPYVIAWQRGICGTDRSFHRRASRDRPLSGRQKSANTTRSKVHARVEHVFGQQQSSMGGKIVRTIGIARARFKIGMMNLGYISVGCIARNWPPVMIKAEQLRNLPWEPPTSSEKAGRSIAWSNRAG